MTALKIDFSSQQLSLLRSDHAGEIGAVNIYKGILWCAKDPVVLAFANCHLEVESRHLESVERILAPENRSIFSPLWIVAGRVLGLVAVAGGQNFLFSTIASVEEFVVEEADGVAVVAGGSGDEGWSCGVGGVVVDALVIECSRGIASVIAQSGAVVADGDAVAVVEGIVG